MRSVFKRRAKLGIRLKRFRWALEDGFGRLSGNSVYVGPAAPLNRVRALVSSFVPEPGLTPLTRIGPMSDGGYLVPDDLEGLAACLSPGTSTEAGFDYEMADRGMPVIMADPTVEGPPVEHPNFRFEKKSVGSRDDTTSTTLRRLIEKHLADTEGDLILQMDIEGAEYAVLLDLDPATLGRLRIMAIEFHHLDQVFAAGFGEIVAAAIAKLKQTHAVVHLHANNWRPLIRRGEIAIPPILEATFHRRDRHRPDPDVSLSYPHPLDAVSVPSRSDIILPEIWRTKQGREGDSAG
ncbi:MAG: FkbM family methyltransferase [Pseudomonadota bacterium]